MQNCSHQLDWYLDLRRLDFVFCLKKLTLFGQLWRLEPLRVVVSSNQDHVLPLDAIARGDAPCLKRGGGEHQTMENINSGEM
ncbi:hypothetical protein HID58_085791 [Brassica napus]|uniref:Uncharacterized protein n=1 Tax=Brassica napus TaxID=3708 RepID=A0ABQ7XNK7_BRANA|nr:hypothetical protein HID58_085791 [Brassica napus]